MDVTYATIVLAGEQQSLVFMFTFLLLWLCQLKEVIDSLVPLIRSKARTTARFESLESLPPAMHRNNIRHVISVARAHFAQQPEAVSN